MSPARKATRKKASKKTTKKATRKKTVKKAARKKSTMKAARKATKKVVKKTRKKAAKKKAPRKKPTAKPKAAAAHLPGKVVEETYDVVVVGGGLAGICAAIAAARHGCTTALVQDRPVLGGNSSSEIRVPPGGANQGNAWARETGIVEELMTEDRARNYDVVGEGRMNPQWDMVLYEAVRAEPNLTLHLNTSARRAEMASGKRIAAVVAEQVGSERTIRIAGKVFIDCTGDGTVGAAAGAQFRYGREARKEFDEPMAPEKADGQTQGSSLMFHSTDVGHPVPFTPPPWAERYPDKASLAGRRCHARDGIYAGYWWCEIGAPYHTIDDNEAIREEALRHLMGVWDHIKNVREDANAENLVLDWIGTVPGKRESRRLVGDYILRQADLYERNRFDDAVAYGGWFIDVHTMGGILAAADGLPPEALCGDPNASDDVRVPLYAIPLRCLYSKNIDNLLMAGRNLSATHVALGSTRLMLTCALLGQAAGTAAAFCVRKKAKPRAVAKKHIAALQQQLLKDDCYIPGVRNADRGDLALGATVTATSEAELSLEAVADDADMWLDRAQIVPVSERRIDTVSLLLRWRGEGDLELPVELVRVADVWAFNDEPLGPPLAAAATICAGHEGWVDFAFDAAVEPGLYCLRVPARERLAWARSTAMPGVAAACKRTHWRRYAPEKAVNAMRLTPASCPFAAESVVNGVSRTDTWPNLWVSRPMGGDPQAIVLDLGAERAFDTVYLTFDTMLHLDHRAFPPFHRIAQCVRDYAVQIELNGGWETLVEVGGNYQRRRVHRIEAVAARRLRIEVRDTNGEPTARIYEVRVYKEGE